MEELCKELEEMRCEIEMLKAEKKDNQHLSETLRRAFEEQQVNLQNARVEIEVQAKEIDCKSDEISTLKQRYEDLRLVFQEKDSALKHLSLANENIKIGLKEKCKELEKINKELVFALDEANLKAEEQDNMVFRYKKEIEGLKVLLSETQKKYSDAELRAQAPKELRRRDEMLDELVKEKVEVEDQLKWKSEQFLHLEEALNKIQEEFRFSRNEWESEKLSFISKISSLQANLDSEIHASNDLRTQLQMCNQALAHEESRRRLLEIQMHESREMYENIFVEYEEVKSKIEILTTSRDEEIASIRNSMSVKNVILKELELKNSYLEQENEELLESLKEAREAQINGVESLASLKSLRQKFRALVLEHKKCSDKLKSREFHWSQQMTKLDEEMHECLLKLNFKDNEIRELKEKLQFSECSAIQTRMENEEISIVNFILKSKFVEIYCDLNSFDLMVEQPNESDEKRIVFLMEQLEHVNLEYLSMQKELSSYKEMVVELSRDIDRVKEQALQNEIDLQDNLQRVSYALEMANSSVSEKKSALETVEFELQQQKTAVMQFKKVKCHLEIELKRYHDENQEIKRCMEETIFEKMELEKAWKKEEENLLLLLEGKERKMLELELIKAMLEEHLMIWRKSVKNSVVELIISLKSANRCLKIFQKAINSLQQNHATRANSISRKLEKFRATYSDSIEEKLNVVSDIQQRILAYDEGFLKLVESAANSQLAEKLNEKLEELKAAQILDKQELQYKTVLISELEKAIASLQVKLVSQEKLSSELAGNVQLLQTQSLTEKIHSEKLNEELEKLKAAQILDKQELQYKTLLISESEKTIVSLQVKLASQEKLSSELAGSVQLLQTQSETEKLHLETELNKLHEAENMKKSLFEAIENLSQQREQLIDQIMGLGDIIGKTSVKGEEVRRKWDEILHKTVDGVDSVNEMENNELISCKMVHGRKFASALRWPLKEHNDNY